MNFARLRNILIGSAGNLVEWFDFYAYSSLSIYFATVFFPKADYTAQLLSAAAIFAVGFLMRPIGAWVMGVYGDRHGRKAGLTLSVALMAGGSLLIAIAPTYATAGLAAPAILLVARMMQGLSVGGEYGASATYLSEMASRTNRGFWSSFQYVTLVGGQLLSLAVLLALQSWLSEAELTAWGWRIPFAIGTLLALLVYWSRRHLDETASYKSLSPERERSSIAALWRDHRREVLLVAAITAGGSLSFYAYTTYLQKFLVNTTHLSKPAATEVMAIALFLFMLMQPAFGWLADRIGRKPLLLFFGVGGMVASIPVFSALAGAQTAERALPIVMIPLVVTAAYTSISAVVKAELFPAGLRTLGVALPYAVGNALFGGSAEYVALWFKQSGAEDGFYWYVTGLLGVASLAILLLPETGRTSRIAEG